MGNRWLARLIASAWSLAMITMGGGFSVLFFAPHLAQATELGADCAGCHEKQVASFKASYHAKIWQGKNDCQSCHGATGKHTDDPSRQTVISFNRGSGRSADELSQQCLDCHKKSEHLTLWDMGEHKKNDVACVACHTIHAPRSTVKQPEICFNCHKDVRSDANKISHHPIIEGKVRCSNCHNTHGTLTKHMINAESTNQLCYKCHADKRGPFIYEHPPVAENCLICHAAHGSRHESLLVEKVVNLCQDCHDNTDAEHQGAANVAANMFSAASSSRRVSARGCIECHHAIHGSASFKESFTR